MSRLSALWDSVLNLILPAGEQLAILEAAGDKAAVDELALDYDDGFRMVSDGGLRGQLTHGEIAALIALDRQLDRMSGTGNADNWTAEALHSSECWKEVRRLAAVALASRQIAKKRSAA